MNTINPTRDKIKVLVPMRFPVGGIRTYLKYTLGYFDQSRFAFTFLGPADEWLRRIQQDLPGLETSAVALPETASPLLIFFSIARELRRRKYDLIHSQGFSAGLSAVIANMTSGLPHIVTFHRIFNESQHMNTYWDNFASLKKLVISTIISRADVLHFVSNDCRENITTHMPRITQNEKKLIVIRNGIAIPEPAEAAPCDLRIKDVDSRNSFGFFGRYMPEKGFDRLIEAVEDLAGRLTPRDFRIHCIGGFDCFIREYRKIIKEKELDEYFLFYDFFPEIFPIVSQLDAVIVPSLGEACGLVPMEALASGTPVIAFSCLGVREVLRDTPALLVAPGDSRALAASMALFMENKQQFVEKFRLFQNEAVSRFSAENPARKTEALYRKLIAS